MRFQEGSFGPWYKLLVGGGAWQDLFFTWSPALSPGLSDIFFKDTSDMYTILGNIADMYTIYDISLETRFSKKHVFKSRKINLDRIDTTFMVLG